MSFWGIWNQFFPPSPSFTEKDVGSGSQTNKVFIVTGANSGKCLGLHLVKLLYPTGATVYLAGRSPDKIQRAIEEITSTSPPPSSPATLKPLYLDLADLTTIKPAATSFAAQETRLDVLWNNAGINCPPGVSYTKQNVEIHVGANCVGPLLYTQELLPLLRSTAQIAVKDSVRVVWSGSIHIEMTSPPGGVDFDRIENPKAVDRVDYGISKAGNYFLAYEGARRWGKDGRNLYTPMYDNENWVFLELLKKLVLYGGKHGARTMLYAGLSPQVNESNNGTYIWPWGRNLPPARPDVVQAVAEGKAALFWEWCERHSESYR
ncbi:hypothetical protein CHU98_g11410 [Xylaria longipes]|nr:hypothetical protein CHU98_g11410 [Xylaria longipes]